MEAIDAVPVLAKELVDGRGLRLGHLHHHDLHLVAFGLRTALEPSEDLLGTSSLAGGNGFACIQINNQGMVTVSLAPRLLINANGPAKLAWAATPPSLEGPPKHRAFGETIATSPLAARAAVQIFLPYLAVEPPGPLHMLAKGLILLPRSMLAVWARKAP